MKILILNKKNIYSQITKHRTRKYRAKKYTYTNTFQ